MDKNEFKKTFANYTVGEKFDRLLNADGAVFETDNNTCFCTISVSGVTETEIQAVNKGNIKADLCSINGVTFICLNISNVLSFDMPFNMALYSEPKLKDPGNMMCYPMLICLVERKTNILRAMRFVVFERGFSRRLYDLSQEQCKNGVKNYDKKVKDIYRMFTTAQLTQMSSVYNVFGGGKCYEKIK